MHQEYINHNTHTYPNVYTKHLIILSCRTWEIKESKWEIRSPNIAHIGRNMTQAINSQNSNRENGQGFAWKWGKQMAMSIATDARPVDF